LSAREEIRAMSPVKLGERPEAFRADAEPSP